MNLTSEQATKAIEALMQVQKAANNFLMNGLPVFQQFSKIVGKMAEEKRELPTAEERSFMKSFAAGIDAAAEAAIAAAKE